MKNLKQKAIKSELSLDMTRFVNKIQLNSEIDFVKNALDGDEGDINTLIINVFKKSAQLTKQKDSQANPIKSAIEWAINSKSNI